jgi:hypothetical protein
MTGLMMQFLVHDNPPEGNQMGDNKKRPLPVDAFPDIPHMIRSIQRIKGCADCFGMPTERCDPASCCWYELCLKACSRPVPEVRFPKKNR